MFFVELLTRKAVGLIEKWLLFPRKMVCAGTCLILKLIEYTNDHSPDASIIPTF